MMTSDLVDRHLRHAWLHTDWVVVHDSRRDEQYYRSETKNLRTHSYRSGSRVEADYGRYTNPCQHTSKMIGDLHAVSRRPVRAGAEYAPYWRWLAALGMAVTAIGLVIGVAVPGSLTGAAFPIGITVLLAVAYRARPRQVTSLDAS